LCAVAVFLILSNILFALLALEPGSVPGILGEITKQLDLVGERNFATWFSVILLFLNSLLAYRQALLYTHSKVRVARIYGILSIGFLVLSVDDLISFHEYVESVLKKLSQGPASRPFLSVNLGLVFGIVLGITLLFLVSGIFFRHTHQRNRFVLILSAALIFMSVLSEFIYNSFHWFDLVRGFRIEIAIDESCELSAVLFFLIFQQREMTARTKESLKMEANH